MQPCILQIAIAVLMTAVLGVCAADDKMPNDPYVIFLGTGAADIATPKVDRCDNCTYIREHGGRNWRRFSSLFVSPNVLIDYSTTGRAGLKKCGVDPAGVDYLLITHSHGDHFNPAEIVKLAKERSEKADGCLKMFCNQTAAESMNQHLSGLDETVDIEITTLHHNESFQAGMWKGKTLPANHDPNQECLLYVLTSGEKSLFYATDTGWFPSGTFGAIAQEKLDLAIVEGTFGEMDDPELMTGHMVFGFDRLIKRFLEQKGALKPGGRFALTHLSLHWCEPHDKLAPKLAEEGILLPYDGLKVDL